MSDHAEPGRPPSRQAQTGPRLEKVGTETQGWLLISKRGNRFVVSCHFMLVVAHEKSSPSARPLLLLFIERQILDVMAKRLP